MNNVLAFLRSKVGKDSADSISPLMQWLNPTLILAQEGHLEYRHEIREEMTNPMHILHGGITAAMIDDAIGATVYSLNNSHLYTTVNLCVDYFAPAKTGDMVIAEAQVVKKGDQVMHATCTLWNADKSRMIAKGHSNLIKTKIALENS